MLIFSRNKSPWIAAAFICVIAVGAFMRFEQSAEEEAQLLAKDKESFEVFKKDLGPLQLTQENLNSRVLFEFYRCGVHSIVERTYCSKINDNFVNTLSPDQRKEIIPILEKHFKRGAR